MKYVVVYYEVDDKKLTKHCRGQKGLLGRIEEPATEKFSLLYHCKWADLVCPICHLKFVAKRLSWWHVKSGDELLLNLSGNRYHTKGHVRDLPDLTEQLLQYRCFQLHREIDELQAEADSIKEFWNQRSNP